MKTINIIFPNQLFENSELLSSEFSHYLIEEYLFFNQYNSSTNKKFFFQRCSMKNYFDYLKSKHLQVNYIESFDEKIRY